MAIAVGQLVRIASRPEAIPATAVRFMDANGLTVAVDGELIAVRFETRTLWLAVNHLLAVTEGDRNAHSDQTSG